MASANAEGGSIVDVHDGARRIEAVSLLGAPLFQPEFPPEVRQRLDDDLERARANFEADPANEDHIIWYGRRLAYLGRYSEALGVFTQGMATHPTSARLRRHAGHRLITLRRFEDAVVDLQAAADIVQGTADEVEPDGAPNEHNIPRSTLQTNIWYHLGLAHYLLGDYEQALAAYARCLALSPNDDMIVATVYWQYLTLRKLDRPDDATALLEAIDAEMEILENDAYHALLLMFKGDRDPRDILEQEGAATALNVATIGYGVGAWYLVQGNRDAAMSMFRSVIEQTNWAAFGHIAAEAELARAQEGRE